MTERDEFLEQRKTCIGGSDVADLLDAEPFGCERRLFYDKTRTPIDFPDHLEFNPNVQRGKVLEDIAISEFCRSKGYKLIERAPKQIRHPQYDFMGANLDAIVMKHGSVDKVALECKIPSTSTFMTIKFSGKPFDSWVFQNKYEMLCSGLKHGVVCVFNADRMETLEFPQRAEPMIEADLIQVAQRFWDTVRLSPENPFVRKRDDYFECSRCEWRKTCKGLGRVASAVTEEERPDIAAKVWVNDDSLEFEQLVTAYLDAKAARKECAAEEERLKTELDAALAGRCVKTASGIHVWWQTVVKNYKAQPAKPAEQRKSRELKVIEP